MEDGKPMVGSKRPRARKLKCHGHKTTGEPCDKWAMNGWEVCYKHGANGGRPVTKGRYSELPARLQAAYEESRNDASLTDLTETLALLDALVKSAAERLSDRDTPEFRAQALALYRKWQHPVLPGEGGAAMLDLGDLLECGAEEAQAENHLAKAVERLSLRIEEAWRIKLARGHVVNAKDLVGILSMILSEIRARCPPEIAAAIVRAIEVRIGGMLGMQERPALPERTAEVSEDVPDERDR